MAVVVTEQNQSREFDGNQYTLQYVIKGTDSESTALTNLKSTAASTHGGLPRVDNEISIKPRWVNTSASDGVWEGTVPYRYDLAGAGGGAGSGNIEFDTTGGTSHIVVSRGTENGLHGGPGETGSADIDAPDNNNMIGINANGVDGCDITTPQFSWSETYTWADASVSAAYVATLYALTGSTNNATFKGFAAGEVLFLGARGRKIDSDTWEITYNFVASPNRVNIDVGSIQVASKTGWQYLWVLYEESEDTTAKKIIKKPFAAYVETVYPSGSMSGLNIGTASPF